MIRYQLLKFFTLVSIILFPQILAAEWVEYGKTGKYTMYYDDNLIDKKGSNIWVWNALNFEKAQDDDGTISFVIKYRLDCKKNKVKTLTFETFNKHQIKSGSAQGKRTSMFEPNEYIQFKPGDGSITEYMFKKVCNKFYK